MSVNTMPLAFVIDNLLPRLVLISHSPPYGQLLTMTNSVEQAQLQDHESINTISTRSRHSKLQNPTS